MVDLSSLPAYAAASLRALGPVATERDGWLCHCPNPRHGGDSHPSLRVTVGDSGRLLVLCRSGCPTGEVLQAAGLTYRDLHCPAGETPLEPLAMEASELTQADAELRDEVYRSLLGVLKLGGEHLKSLLARGLDAQAVSANQYRTLDRAAKASAPKKLFREYGDSLFGVPGFRPSGGGASFSTGVEGIVIPCRSREGLIVALKVRRDDKGEGPRYVYLSGTQEGEVSSGTHLHHPVPPPGVLHGDYVLVTEGELKADVTQHLTGRQCVSVPGVSLWRKAVDELADIADARARTVVAFDWPDVVKNYAVFSAARDFIRGLRDVGVNASLLTWDEKLGKGVDDMYAGGGVPVTVSGEDLTRKLDALEQAHNHVPMPVATASLVSGEAGWKPAPFPTWVFPPKVAAFVKEVSTSKSCPADFPGTACLNVAASAVGTTRAIRMKSDWVERPCLYSIIVAEAGSRKSPALKAVLAPVYRHQGLIYSRDEKSSETVYVNDSTLEALGAVLEKNPRGVLQFRDEAAGFFLDFNKYRGGKGGDRQAYLTFWSCEPWKINRKSGDPIHIPMPYVSILGGIQPALLSEMEDRSGREDGFIHRFDFSMPEAQTYPGWDESFVSESAMADWSEAVTHLYTLKHREEQVGDGKTMAHSHVLNLSPAAKRLYVDWYNAHQDEIRNLVDLKLKGPWAKMEAKCARYALVLRLLWTEDPDGLEEVQAGDVERAIALVDYYKSHSRGVYSRLKNTAEDDHVVRLLQLVAASPGQSVTVREAMRGLKLHTKTATSAVFKRAADLGKGSVARLSYPNNRSAEVFTTRED